MTKLSDGPTMFSLRTPTKADAVYEEIRARIIDTRLSPGSRLDQEALAASLGVSTTPLREALRRLEAEHLVQRGAHKQVVIAPLSRTELAQLYMVRMEIDPLAARLASTSATPDELAQARELMTNPRHNDGSYGWLKHYRAFHRALYDASHNAVVIELLDWLYDRSERYRYVLHGAQQKLTAAHTEHQALVDAIAAGDGALASEIMRRHVEESAFAIDAVISARPNQIHFSP